MIYTLRFWVSKSLFIVILTAVFGLLGYLPSLGLLGSVRENYIPMAPSTAISFIFISFAFLTLSIKELPSFISAMYLAGVLFIAAFGLLEIVGYFTGVDLNFEDSIYPDAGYMNGVPLGKMSPATGLGFFFSGISVFFLILKKMERGNSRVNQYISGWCGISILLFSFIFCLAYANETPLLYGIEATIPMALTTAVGFLFLSFSILAFDKNSFPIKYFTGFSTRAYLLRFFVPLVMLAMLLGNFLLRYFNQFFIINPALTAASLTILMAIIAGVAATILSTKIAAKIDHRSVERFKSVAENTSDLIWEVDANINYTFYSDKVERILGYSKDEIIGKSPFSFMEPDESKNIRKIFAEITKEKKSFRDLETWRLTKDGRNVCLAMSGEAILDDHGTLLGYYGSESNITERKRIEDKLKVSIDELERVFNLTGYMVCIASDEGYFLKVSPAFTETLGFSEKEFLAKPFLDFIHPDDKKATEEQMGPMARGIPIIKFSNRYLCKEGSYKWLEWTARSFVNGGDIYAVANNVTERKTAEEKLERIALYDMLTNLPNRVLLADRLNQAMVQCRRRKQSLAVAFMDLDGFKAVNDTYGHNVGDELLVALSKRMKETLRDGDTLARIGGDEFIAVLVDLEQVEDSQPLLERLLKAAADPITLGDAVINVSASIGVTLYPQDAADADQLMRHADQAMYIAKLAGKNRYQLFDIAQENVVNIQRKSIGDVRLALERDEFVLHYQPKVNMRTSKVIGLEALIRWQHPAHGIIPPLDFLPAIEGHAISLELGEWVIDTALSQISQWQSLGVNLPVSVNISAYQLTQENFSDRLRASLANHPDVNASSLELEILETTALSDISQVSATMSKCHELGVSFALDDFGTGYSSLTYLRRLPAYLIKIDQSFVRDMLYDGDDLAIIEGIISLAKAFQREVIAEGVETVAHGEALLKLGCDLAQGYGIARPMPAGDIAQWLSSWKTDKSWHALIASSMDI
jgi:diguanylate cyclase (GGDEF)-like protein/PAS domain S-box-containing protein